MDNRNFWGNGKINTGSIIIGAIVMIVAFVLLLSLAQLTYKLLTFIAVPLLIITAIIDYKVITSYFNWILSVGKRNLLFGIGLGLISAVLYPLVAAILFGRAFFTWRLKRAMNNRGEEMDDRPKQIGEYIDYEDLTKSKPTPKVKQSRAVKDDNDYDRFFDEK